LLALVAVAVWLPQAAAQTAAPAPPPAAAAPGAPAQPESAQPTTGDDRATIEAAKKWLALLDAGKTGAAWDAGSPYLKSVVTREKWIDGIGSARRPFGKFVQR